MTSAPPCLRVLLLSPFGIAVNPYIGLLREGLTAAGADVRLAHSLAAVDLVGPLRPDVIHLHWLEHYDLPSLLSPPALASGPSLLSRGVRRAWEAMTEAGPVYALRRWRRLGRLLAQLRNFQRAGGRVAYTVHNLDPHEGGGLADRWGLAALVRMADLLHVHDASSAEALAARFGRRNGVAIIPHGHYIGAYPNTVSRAEARAALDLPADVFVYLSFGLMRPYKGLEELIPAFRRLRRSDIRLLLAGQPKPKTYGQILNGLAAGDPRIRLDLRFVPTDQVQFYFNAADVCVLPYRQVTTSGAALLALSFGRPVVAPAIGAFPTLLADGRGVLYDPTEPGELGRSLMRAGAIDWSGAQSHLLKWVRQFDWGQIGRQLIDGYLQQPVLHQFSGQL